MQFGLFMMPLHPPYRSFADCYDRDIDQLVLADRLGFREAWLGEHITERWENAPAPDLLIAKALALTEHIRLGTGVTLLALHHPVYLAHRLAMLDHMARGRFQWGIGGGGIPTDLAIFGIDASQPSDVRARSAEVLDVVLKLWASEGKFSYHGRFFDIDAPEMDDVKDRGYYMKPYQQPHPPIAVAASTPTSASIRMAGERGWIPMTSSLLSQPYLKGHWELVAEGAASAGRQADRSQWRIARDVFVAPTPSLARERARAVLGRNFVQHQLPNRAGSVQMKSTKLDPAMPDEAVDVDYLMEHVWIVGDPQECADKIRQLYEACGGFGTLLSITADSDEASWDHESLRLLIEEVGPRVADLT
jgi:alkanesulfonate monooxygenase SsuD/methylene tetrahydromethanopterin reductase-like flavin-dependent oxidoreductase (luciferase family)